MQPVCPSDGHGETCVQLLKLVLYGSHSLAVAFIPVPPSLLMPFCFCRHEQSSQAMILGLTVQCCLGTTHAEMPKLLLAGVCSANPVLLLVGLSPCACPHKDPNHPLDLGNVWVQIPE